ncbi:hypothetical protein RvY_04818 [Ramazzottius varieornatus]|uniref:Uncharacterized protein n=1 Tax=Ramazzottius varieornatus TaxID=947166 RepID=A0A1D1V2S9_RAMVA|nr:hypothetical protein RvY_04818 [Ramazzottius varieornatus]
MEQAPEPHRVAKIPVTIGPPMGVACDFILERIQHHIGILRYCHPSHCSCASNLMKSSSCYVIDVGRPTTQQLKSEDSSTG